VSKTYSSQEFNLGAESLMASVHHPLLCSLFRRLIMFFSCTIIGCLGLIVSRLNYYQVNWPDLLSAETIFYVDCACLSLFALGLILTIYYARALAWRLHRIDDLGESNW
jgi:hypothetical protein